MVLLVMTQQGLDGLLRDQFKLGASAGIAVVTLGSGVEGALAGPNPPDIVVWSRLRGCLWRTDVGRLDPASAGG